MGIVRFWLAGPERNFFTSETHIRRGTAASSRE